MSFDIKDTHSIRGRIAIAKNNYKSGSCILQTQPFVSVLKHSTRKTFCNYCFRPKEVGSNLLRCSKCKTLFYCSRECQMLDWTLHKFECVRLIAISPKVPTETVLLGFRVLQKAKLERMQEMPKEQGNSYSDFSILQANRTENDSMESAQKFMAMSVMLHDFLGEDLVSTPKEMLDLLCRLETNSFNISDSEFKPIGIGIYPVAALINHDCNPNCGTVFIGRQVRIVAIRDIEQNEEITISYIEILQPLQQRREEIRNSFGFLCKCDRCLGDEKPDSKDRLLTGFSCPMITVQQSNEVLCKGVITFNTSAENSEDVSVCDRCGNKVHRKEILQRLLESRELIKKASEECEDEKRKSLIGKAIKVQRDILCPTNTELLETHNIYLDCCLKCQDFSRALQTCNYIILVMERLCPVFWPPKAHIYLLHAKLSAHLNELENAQFSLQSARKVLAVVGGQLVSESEKLAEIISSGFAKEKTL